MRAVVDAILYVVKADCQWRSLPKQYGPWMSAYSHFRRMRSRGEWDRRPDDPARAADGARGPQPPAHGGHGCPFPVGQYRLKRGSAVSMPARRSKVASATLRWIVERTFAWLGWSCRLSKDSEVRPERTVSRGDRRAGGSAEHLRKQKADRAAPPTRR